MCSSESADRSRLGPRNDGEGVVRKEAFSGRANRSYQRAK